MALNFNTYICKKMLFFLLLLFSFCFMLLRIFYSNIWYLILLNIKTLLIIKKELELPLYFTQLLTKVLKAFSLYTDIDMSWYAWKTCLNNCFRFTRFQDQFPFMSKNQIASVCPKIMIGANARLLNAKASVAQLEGCM